MLTATTTLPKTVIAQQSYQTIRFPPQTDWTAHVILAYRLLASRALDGDEEIAKHLDAGRVEVMDANGNLMWPKT